MTSWLASRLAFVPSNLSPATESRLRRHIPPRFFFSFFSFVLPFSFGTFSAPYFGHFYRTSNLFPRLYLPHLHGLNY